MTTPPRSPAPSRGDYSYQVIDERGIPRPVDVADDGTLSFVNASGTRVRLTLRS